MEMLTSTTREQGLPSHGGNEAELFSPWNIDTGC